MLTVLSMLLKTAVEWNVIDRVPCAIRLLQSPEGLDASFYDVEEYGRLEGGGRALEPHDVSRSCCWAGTRDSDVAR